MVHKKRKPVRVKGKLVIPRDVEREKTKRKVSRGLSERDRLELARARGGAGQRFAIEEGKLVSTTEEERKAKDIKETAKRSFEIGEEKKRLGQEQLIQETTIAARPIGQEAIQAELAERGIVPGIQQAQAEFIARIEGKKPLEEMAAYQQLLLQIAAVGGVGLPGQFGAFAANEATFEAIASGNAQQKAAMIGRFITPTTTQYATNGKSIVKTSSWLIKLGITTGIAGGLLTIIGTYPFGGFIKEESLQTLSFGIRTAKEEGDLNREEEAIIQTEELLNPGTWQTIINKIPFLNIQQNLKEFFKAAAIKIKIDRTSFEKRRGEFP